MKQTKNIKEIERTLREISDPADPFLAECKADTRIGVINLVSKWNRDYEKQMNAQKHFEQMSNYEQSLRSQGFQSIAGIDEVGRGPLAGPVVASAVILPEGFYLEGLNDSKKIPEARREIFYEIIMKEAVSTGIGILHSEEIDRWNIYESTKKAMLAAIADLVVTPDHLLIDAMELVVPMPQLSIIKGDAKSISIAAASIIAKVTRDGMMREYAKKHPRYDFENNMGYGTAKHLEALHTYGATPWHRRSFSPVREVDGE
ncbi:ribonuclease HII [Bacillus sp. CECT 9360]|uniref:ribonuclease HII n=1 Tax=Bacillus sp. CECT 9360 TaxID=2845821 RepID=UPI001E2B0060|nr:ribonuclease HII [Bacillus sp. CECT 9360]CAH0346964.1 Ribonuclease HII [Bacillus sp. CECT 9360]